MTYSFLPIGFVGNMGAGKSTAVKYIEEFAYQIKIISRVFVVPMAFEIKRIARALGWDGKTKNAKVRKALQLLGTEVGREGFGEDCWLNLWQDECEYIASHVHALIVLADDVRFPNEANRIKSLGGKIISIECDRDERISRLRKRGDDLPCSDLINIMDHPSEKLVATIKPDFIINSEKSPEDFKKEVTNLFYDIISDEDVACQLGSGI